MHREPGQCVRHQRTSALGNTSVVRAWAPCPLAIASRAVTAQDRGSTCRRRLFVDERAREGKLRLCRGETVSLQCEERQFRARQHAGPGCSTGDGRVRSIAQDCLRSLEIPREQHGHPSQDDGDGVPLAPVTGRPDNASSASIRICSTPFLPEQGADRGRPRLERAPVRHRSSDRLVSTASAHRSAASGRPRNACTQTPSTATAGYARAGWNRRSARASSRLSSRGHCGSTFPRARRRASPPHRCRPPRPSTRSQRPAVHSRCTTRPPRIESRREVGVASSELGLEHLPEQVVVAEPAALVVEGNDEQVLALQLLEHLSRVIALEHRVAERAAHRLEDRRPK